MYLYNLTISRASGIQCAIYGNFSAPKAQEIVVSRGKLLELLRPDENGKMQVIHSTEVFGVIRALTPFRLTGGARDYIIVGSDSGRIVILEYSKERNSFVKVHQETFGKSGSRRIVPGEYLAVDPKGRACMIGAIEKQKLVYVLNRDSAANLTISSPLEAHKSHNIVFCITGLDQGFDNPVFAAVELDYSEADQDPTGEAASQAQKHLTFYELDLGLNHVVRKWSEPVDNGANLLVAVPGGADGPGGVLVCAENYVIYKNQDHPEVRAVIPRRTSLAGERGVLIVSYATHKQKTMFFFLLQSEYGDLYKVTLSHEGDKVHELRVKYFDTIPPAVSICMMKKGFLFAASEFGNHALYQFQSIGDDDDAVESSSAALEETDEGIQAVYFEPRKLRNLMLIDALDSLMPVMDMKVENLFNEEVPQIFAACGAGARSSLRVLRPGLAVAELAVSDLPGNPTAVFTIKRSNTDEFDAYIIVSFSNATLVLSVGETVEEVSDSGFLATAPTLRTQLLADDSMLQVHPGGLRHIRADGRVNEWRAPGRKTISVATTNRQQVIIALQGGELIYFELNAMGQLLETDKKDMSGEVSSLDVAPVAEGRQRSRFLAVGSYDSTVRVLNLDPDDCMKVLAVQAVGAAPESLLILDSPGAAADGGDVGVGTGALFLHVGLANGVLLRSEIDRVTGQLADTRSRFLGTKPPTMVALEVRGQRSMLALSSRPWLGYSDQGRYNLMPLSYSALDYASGFSSDQVSAGIVGVARSTLRVITVERLGELFNQQVMALSYTPRKMQLYSEYKLLYIGESDHSTAPPNEEPSNPDEEMADAEPDGNMGDAAASQWGACVRVVDPAEMKSTHVEQLEEDETVTAMCLVAFEAGAEHGTMLAVATAQSLTFYPRQANGGFLRVFKLLDNGTKLSLLHKTPVDGIPGAMAACKGKLAVGVGAALRMYDLGKKKLLKRCEYRRLPNFICSLSCLGSRLYVGDLQESVFYMKYKKLENKLYVFAEDLSPRYVTTAMALDYDTVCGADKFGNVFMLRLPAEVSQQVEDDPTGGRFSSTGVGASCHKVDNIINFHVGDTVTAVQRAALHPGGQEVIVYATVMGAIGALLPFTSREDVDFFSHLEMHLRQEHAPLCGRDHLSFRSYYFPVKDVVDGDLCEQYAQISTDKQRSIADELDRSPGEVMKKLEDIRNKVM